MINLEAPEEQYDSRTLYERLQEQKIKKQEAYEESKKMKNLIKGLDNDEIEFLQALNSNRAEVESQKYHEEMTAIDEYKRQVKNLNVEDQEKRLLEFKRELFQQHKEKTNQSNTSGQTKRKLSSQAELLSKVVRRKMGQEKTMNDNLSIEKNKSNIVTAQSSVTIGNIASSQQPINNPTNHTAPIKTNQYIPLPNTPTLQCIGRLPGIGCYDDSSDSFDSDLDSDEDDCEGFRVFPDPLKHKKHIDNH